VRVPLHETVAVPDNSVQPVELTAVLGASETYVVLEAASLSVTFAVGDPLTVRTQTWVV